jgi:hypothetical protein
MHLCEKWSLCIATHNGRSWNYANQIDLDFAKVCQRKPLVVVMITTLPLVLNLFGFKWRFK